jgi:hypothetical protein
MISEPNWAWLFDEHDLHDIAYSSIRPKVDRIVIHY